MPVSKVSIGVYALLSASGLKTLRFGDSSKKTQDLRKYTTANSPVTANERQPYDVRMLFTGAVR